MAKKVSTPKAKMTGSEGPSYLKGKRPVTVPMHSVVAFVKMLQDEGHVDQFVKAAKKSKTVMTMHPDSVNFVKDYLHSNQLHASNATARLIVNPCPDPNDPFECHFT